jgi:iron complex transport system substrate-binding protein
MQKTLVIILATLFLTGPVLRIVSLSPGTTEILFALGLDDEIIGVSTFCNYPPQAQTKEKVGTFSQANIEKILSLQPDIVFCTGLEQAPLAVKLKQLGLNIHVSDPTTIAELFSSIVDIGRLTHKDGAARTLVAEMQAVVKQIEEDVRAAPETTRPKIFVEFWHDPMMSAGKGSFVDELITLAGGTNIAHDMPRTYGTFSPEQVLKNNPDIIILCYMTPQNPESYLKARLGWNKIHAVVTGRVYNDINSDIILRPGPRIVEGLREIRKRLNES